MSLPIEDFQFITQIIKKKSGIFLAPEKDYLVSSRLLPVARKNSFVDVKELIANVRNTNNKVLITEIIEAITTNESLFFRDIKTFDFIKRNVIETIASSVPEKKHFRIWSAACSTGQEPYSLAMSILDNTQWNNKYTFEIIATDISQPVLNKALEGVYSQFEVQRGLPIALLLKHFVQQEGNWKIKDNIKSMVNFSKINLIEDFVNLGMFDIILCRNVMIYFDAETKAKILDNISKLMYNNSYLIIGASETLMGNEKFQQINDALGFYKLK
jgi:chemotaxis protein methyltransferase CheR